MLKSKRILLAVLSLGLLVSGCNEEETVTPSQLTARAGADQNVKVGEQVTIDGTGSTDSNNKPFQFRWTVAKKPAGSTVTLATPSQGKATFTPDLPGDYEVDMTIFNENGENTDKVLVTATIIQPIELERDIRTKTVLENRIDNPNIPDYIVNNNTQVNAELTLKPGVVIAFARDTRLEVNYNGGILIAKGDSAKPIRLIGKEASKGYWSGVIFRSASSANEMEYVQILHAGGKPIISTIKAGFAVIGTYKANLSIKHSLFEDNGGYGLYVDEAVTITGFEKNTFKNNVEAAVLVGADIVSSLDYNSSFTNGNGRNVVEIFASTLKKNVTTEVVWAGFKDKTPYRILEGMGSDANWKIMPGVTIEMGRNARLSIDDGYFNVVGTKTNKIVIRPAENARAYWRGMICFSTSTKNIMENVDISGGGSTALVSGKKTNIAVYGGNSSLQIRDSHISGSGGYGVFVNYQASVNEDIETANTFADNAEGKLLKE
ncbi:PKD domain-containing protein [Dyadobacter sp.]|uniref:PKD domain-containing protein n=1 Tax=Dyadobacter sp. TaxID=1914288 RepID=UPI003F70A440